MGKLGPALCLAVLLSLLWLGCVQPSSGAAAPSEPPIQPVTQYVCPDGRTTVTDITACPPSATTARELSEEEKSLKVCTGMPSFQGVSLEDNCIIGVAGKYKNTSLCMEVGRDQRLGCYALVAELKNDPAICTEAASMADQCYNQYAMDKRDSSICSRITQADSKDSCYDQLASQLSDPALCARVLNVNRKDNCYSNMAMRLGDSSYCNSITNSGQKENCLSNLQNRGGSMPTKPPG